MPSFTLRQLECFLAAAQEGSVTAAADRLHLSQSAVSVALAKLEGAVGVQLFVRDHARGLLLTDPGRDMIGRAERLLEDAELLADSALTRDRSVAGTLNVSCFSTLAPYLLPRALELLGASHPELHVACVEQPTFETLERSLLDGSCELGLAYDHGLPDYLTAEAVAEVRPHALLAADHRLAGREAVSLAELAAEPYVLFDVAQASTYLLSLFRAVGAAPSVRYRTRSVLLLHSLVARGLGFSILNQRPAQLTSVDGVPFLAKPFEEPLPALTVVLLHPARVELTAKADTFLATCREVAAEVYELA
jgi:DNA-binding transcriptional LysR family regulator